MCDTKILPTRAVKEKAKRHKHVHKTVHRIIREAVGNWWNVSNHFPEALLLLKGVAKQSVWNGEGITLSSLFLLSFSTSSLIFPDIPKIIQATTIYLTYYASKKKEK